MAGGGISLQDTVLANISQIPLQQRQHGRRRGRHLHPTARTCRHRSQPASCRVPIARCCTTRLGQALATSSSSPTRRCSTTSSGTTARSTGPSTTRPIRHLWAGAEHRAGQPAVYSDLAVLGTSNPAHQLSPRYSLLTDLTGYGGASNITGDPYSFRSTPMVIRADHSAARTDHQHRHGTGLRLRAATSPRRALRPAHPDGITTSTRVRRPWPRERCRAGCRRPTTR